MAKVLISIREDFLEMVDELASSEHRSRSELIRQALRDYTRGKGGKVSAILDSVMLNENEI